MTANSPLPGPEPIPPDDPSRALTVATPGDPGLAHLSVVGDTYTTLLSGDDTGGRFTLIALGDRFGRVLGYGQPGPPCGQAALDQDERLTGLLRR
jgi:hypothetical protein